MLSKSKAKPREAIIEAQAKYYTKKEALNLFKKAGFKNITVSSRHNYSWVVIGKK